MTKIAVIGGTGLYDFPGLKQSESQRVETPYGEPSSPLVSGQVAEANVVFLARHGNPHKIPPHKVNYRANLWALKSVDVTHIVAVNAVGGITEPADAGVIAIPDQIVDYTYGREHTFSDCADVPLQHVDFSYPYDEELRQRLLSAAKQQGGIDLMESGVYGATQGPRLESAAEINRMDRDGCDLVGMTGMPEAALARELDMPYASICLVVNKGAGRSEGIITMEDIEAVMAQGMQQVMSVLQRLMADW